MRWQNEAAQRHKLCENGLSLFDQGNGAMAHPASESTKAVRYPGFLPLLLGWTLLGSLACIRHILLDSVPHARILRDLADWLTCYIPWVLLTPLVFRSERRFPLNRNQWQGHGVVLLGLGLAIACASTLLADLAFMLERHALAAAVSSSVNWLESSGNEYIFQLALYLVALLAACIIRNLIEMQASERRAAQLAVEKSELEASLRKSELEMLRMRLNPHFLFNSLQNISTLARQNPDAASQMLARLGDVLRAALRKGTPAQTTLASEISLTKAYVEVEQIRFAGRLSVLFEVARELENSLVPGFLLQPLVENAITHGLRGGQSSGAIWVRAVQASSELIVTVSDNGSGPPAERLADLEMGIGLGSTCERLDRLYPGRHSLSMRRLSEGGTEIRIALPLQWADTPAVSQPDEYAPSAHR
jgi:two-component system LytT family sensor kinase